MNDTNKNAVAIAGLIRNRTIELEVLAVAAQLIIAKAKRVRGDAFNESETVEEVIGLEEFNKIVETARECI